MSNFDKPRFKKPKFDDGPNQSKSLASEAELPPIQLDETIVAGRKQKPLNSLQRLLMGIPEFNLIKHAMVTGMDGITLLDLQQFEQRIDQILNSQSIEVGIKNLLTYLAYLKKKMELPCNVTGRELFIWEEDLGSDSGNKKEYKKTTKTKSSYTDIFEIKQFKDSVYQKNGILVEVKRVSDNRDFVLPLVNLKTSDENSPNKVFLDDYSLWFTNH